MPNFPVLATKITLAPLYSPIRTGKRADLQQHLVPEVLILR
jgi:hypothetical protein